MRLRSVIFILLQLSLSFVAVARLIWNAGGIGQCRPERFAGQQGHRRSEEALPFPENDAWLRRMSM
jgi:hypothetical protein